MTTTKKTTTKKATVKTVKTKSTPIPNLPNLPFAFEVLDAASKQRTKARKVEVLQKYKHPSLISLFVWNFDTSIVSLLPEGEVPYGNTKEDQNTTGTFIKSFGFQYRSFKRTNSIPKLFRIIPRFWVWTIPMDKFLCIYSNGAGYFRIFDTGRLRCGKTKVQREFSI